MTEPNDERSATPGNAASVNEPGLFAPLSEPVFRRIWTASLGSNFGLLIVSVAAAWEMTRLSDSPGMVALVQTAIMSPFMVFSMFAGALADVFDRRSLSLVSLGFPIFGAIALTMTSAMGISSPASLLGLCFVVGFGLALFSPSWQASVGEQVSAPLLPSAIALNGISFNIARSVGPALGGILVAAVGVVYTFGVTTLLYIPLLIALLMWKRAKEVSRLPPESLRSAILVGLRYATNSPRLIHMLMRAFLLGFAIASLYGLMPLIARDLLGGGPQLFGLLLAAFGIGAVIGAFSINALSRWAGPEWSIRISIVLMALSIVGIAVSDTQWVTLILLVVAGAAWMAAATIFNVLVQTGSPRWVTARALGMFQTMIAGGLALGSWAWGSLADVVGLQVALLCSSGAMLIFLIHGLIRPVAEEDGQTSPIAEHLPDPDIAMAISGRSGPITIELEYRVDPDQARPFFRIMEELGRSKRRNGARMWRLARDLADPALWVERYRHETWDDYLRHRQRQTVDERRLQGEANDLSDPGYPVIRRLLDRPTGSVRWTDSAPDRGDSDMVRPMVG